MFISTAGTPAATALKSPNSAADTAVRDDRVEAGTGVQRQVGQPEAIHLDHRERTVQAERC